MTQDQKIIKDKLGLLKLPQTSAIKPPSLSPNLSGITLTI